MCINGLFVLLSGYVYFKICFVVVFLLIFVRLDLFIYVVCYQGFVIGYVLIY